MTDKFIAEAIARTQRSQDSKRLEITLAGIDGRTQSISVTAETAAALAKTLEDFAASPPCGGPAPTKIPRHFAVGAGRFERIVLVRFEDEVPYGLTTSDAAALAKALVDQAEAVDGEPALLC